MGSNTAVMWPAEVASARRPLVAFIDTQLAVVLSYRHKLWAWLKGTVHQTNEDLDIIGL